MRTAVARRPIHLAAATAAGNSKTAGVYSHALNWGVAVETRVSAHLQLSTTRPDMPGTASETNTVSAAKLNGWRVGETGKMRTNSLCGKVERQTSA